MHSKKSFLTRISLEIYFFGCNDYIIKFFKGHIFYIYVIIIQSNVEQVRKRSFSAGKRLGF